MKSKVGKFFSLLCLIFIKIETLDSKNENSSPFI